MPDENVFSSGAALPVVVWGTGNVGRAVLRAVDAHPGLRLSAVLVADPRKVGVDAGVLAGLDRELGVRATDDVAGVLAGAAGHGLVYAASGDLRPAAARADVERALRAGADVVTPALYDLYDPRSASAASREPMLAACRAGGSSLLVTGIDPGWANDVLPFLLTGLVGELREVRCQEIFDYSDYDAEATVRRLVGMGEPMDAVPPMVAPGVPTSVWGGQVRLLARALGVELDEIDERTERQALEGDVVTRLGTFRRGTQGALRFEVRGLVAGRPVVVVEHVTRISPTCAMDWPLPPDGADGAHRIVLDADPRLEVTIEAIGPDESRAAGGNATAAHRLVAALPWLSAAPPGLHDGLDVPLSPAAGRLSAPVPLEAR